MFGVHWDCRRAICRRTLKFEPRFQAPAPLGMGACVKGSWDNLLAYLFHDDRFLQSKNLAEASFLVSKAELNAVDPALYMAVLALILWSFPIFLILTLQGLRLQATVLSSTSALLQWLRMEQDSLQGVHHHSAELRYVPVSIASQSSTTLFRRCCMFPILYSRCHPSSFVLYVRLELMTLDPRLRHPVERWPLTLDLFLYGCC